MFALVGERTSMIYRGCFVMTDALTHIMAHTAAAATVYGTIVVGRRGSSRVEEFLMGRVSSKVLHQIRGNRFLPFVQRHGLCSGKKKRTYVFRINNVGQLREELRHGSLRIGYHSQEEVGCGRDS